MQNKFATNIITKKLLHHYTVWMQYIITKLQVCRAANQSNTALPQFSFAAKIHYSDPFQHGFAALQNEMIKPPFYLHGSLLFGSMNNTLGSYNKQICNPATLFCIAAKCINSIQNIIVCLTWVSAKPTCMVVKLHCQNGAIQNKIVPLHCHSPPAYKWQGKTKLITIY
jgi:hypothetical protein